MRAYISEVINSVRGLERIQSEWDHLYETSKAENAFMTYEWARSWWRHFGEVSANDRRELYIVVLRLEGNTRAILPLMRRFPGFPAARVRKLEFLGQGMPDYLGFLLRDNSPEVLGAVAKALAERRNEWEIIDLADAVWDEGMMQTFRQTCDQNGLKSAIRLQSRCPFLPLSSNAAKVIETFSKDRRHTIRNQAGRLRRLEAEGVRIRIIEHPECETDVLEKLAAVERLKKDAETHIINRNKNFWRDLIRSLGPKRQLFVAVMEKGDRLVAYQLGFRVGCKLWNYQVGFDPEFASYSPGTMLIPSVIDYGFSHGYKEYDFLRGEESYKLAWAKQRHETVRMLIWNSRIKSQTTCSLLRLRQSWRALPAKGENPIASSLATPN